LTNTAEPELITASPRSAWCRMRSDPASVTA
jgi:hypothetical protein